MTGIQVNAQSVLSAGTWYKIAVEKNGVYRIGYDELGRMGFNVRSVDPKTIQIFGYPAGMLPQPNSTPRPDDLVELAIHVEGEGDASFDRNDYILFYAQGPDRTSFRHQNKTFFIEKNLYSDKNFYYVTAGTSEGKRNNVIDAGSGGQPIKTYHDFVVHETDRVNILRSGREWFGENFDLNTQQSFDFDISGITEGSDLKIVSEVMSESFNPSSFDISLNDVLVSNQAVPVVPDSPYAARGRIKRDTTTVNASSISASTKIRQSVRYNFKRAASRRSIGYLNFFSLHFERRLEMQNGQIIFQNGNATDGSYRFSIDKFSPSDRIWDISDPFNSATLHFINTNGSAEFSRDAGQTPNTFVAFASKAPAPEMVGKVINQNLRGMSVPDLLIVCHPDFLAEANRLASHRNSFNHLDVAVATTEQIYNEFSSGRQDVSAIRDLARSLYLRNPSKLKSLLLIGKSSYDYKQRIEPNRNFVPTYESRNSLLPLETYSSDDYFAFLEEDEGEWNESNFSSHTMDIGVGRLPVKTREEASRVVDKLIHYDLATKTLGRWRKDIVFVADDGSNTDGFSSVHQSQANSMAENIELNNRHFNTRKIFLGTYSKNVSPNGETAPAANRDIMGEFSDALIINYTGHGSEKLWADERILTEEDIISLKNRTYPFLVTATCEFGRHDDPKEISSAELTLLQRNGGSIGLVTTARPVNSSTNFELNQAFYDAFFTRESGEWRTIGEVVRHTKNNSTSGVANRNFSLLGDPSMTLAAPRQNIEVDQIKTVSGSDTLKALSHVVVRGRILKHDGSIDLDFSGVIEATLFDKQTKFQTIGKNNPAFKYSQWFNPLFRGEATVQEGSFELTFIMPRNIAYEVNHGKLSLYASDKERNVDATGAANSFKIGQSEPNPPTDNTPPQIQAFMEETSFRDGATVGSNTTLLVRIQDESGINVSNYGIGNTMMAILDDEETFLINEHFSADIDDFTRGWVRFPMYGLTEGKHTLTVKAWDAYNNPAETTITFRVSSENGLALLDVGNFPNPFDSQTTVFFTHNRPGDELLVNLSIVNATGIEIISYTVSVPESPFRVNLLDLGNESGFGKKLAPGLYFARFKIRSVTDGSESTGVAKLIVAN